MEPDTINPMAVLAWLRRMSRKLRFGKDTYQEAWQLIHNLMEERRQLNEKVEKLEKEIARLQTPRVRGPYEVEGQGKWGDIT